MDKAEVCYNNGNKMNHVVIIGNGITGITAARCIRKKCNWQITVISAESPYFYSRTALMYIYMGHMTYEDTKPYENCFWNKNNIILKQDLVTNIDHENKQVILRQNGPLPYDKLVIATGSASNKFGWQGQDLKGVQGLYNLNDLKTLDKNAKGTRHAVIVGGGLIGLELCEMLLSQHIPVTFLVRENHFWDIVLPDEESMLIERHIRKHHVDLRLNTELKEILPDTDGRVRAVVTGQGETIDCQLVGLTVGVHPNIHFLEGSGIETDRGVLVNEFFETSIKNVYAGGDCAQFRNPPENRRPVEQVWYTGKMHGEHIAENLTGNSIPYRPGIWFNSAKFFQIEYQTYGMVPSKLPENQETFYWEHPSGEKSIRINYRTKDQSVTGFNLFGIRGRHSVCEYFISNRCSLEHVLENFGAINFEPEFFRGFETDVISHYNHKPKGKILKLETRKGRFSSYINAIFRNNKKGT